MIDLDAVLTHLAKVRPVFHSEADFQLALAMALERKLPRGQVRPEIKPEPRRNQHIDILVRADGLTAAIEVKYTTRRLSVTVLDEEFWLADHSNQIPRRYSILADLHRVERWVTQGIADVGHVVALTNNPSYWNPARSSTIIDAALRIHEGRVITGPITDPAYGRTGNRKAADSLIIHGQYVAHWRDYSVIADRGSGRFRLLHLIVRQGQLTIPI